MGNFREQREPWLTKWVRRCEHSPHRFQLRVYCGSCKRGIYPVNFGVYPSESEAGRVAKLVRQGLARGLDLWTIMRQLIASGDVREGITARWVHAVEGGVGIRARSRGVEIHLPGPFQTAGEARRAAHAVLKSRLQTAMAA